MIVVYTPKFSEQLAAALDFGIARFGKLTAERTYARIIRHIEVFLAEHPRAATYVPEFNVYRSWVPKTPYVVFYRSDPATGMLTVLALLHHGRDHADVEIA
jgi:plasmid stabilization system protein ParE